MCKKKMKRIVNLARVFALILCAFLLQNYGYCHANGLNRVSKIISRSAGKDRLLQGYESLLIRKDPTSSGILGSNPRKLAGLRVDQEGRISSFEIAKQQLANELLLPLRDLRIVDPSYPSQIQATMVARPNVILFSVDHLKMIIKHNEVLIFNANREEVRRFVPLLQQQLIIQSQANTNTNTQSVHNETYFQNQTALSSDEYSLLLSHQRFEHVVLETALNLISVTLSSAIRSIEPAVAAALLDLRVVSRGLDVIQTQVDELLPLKNKIDELRQRCKEIQQCIFDVLHSDEDMKMMFLKPVSITEELKLKKERDQERRKATRSHLISRFKKSKRNQRNYPRVQDNKAASDSVDSFYSSDDHALYRNTQVLEILLENYLNEVEWVTSEVDDLLNEITNTEENVVLQLDLIRNRILKFELYLSISSFVVTCGALITGLFGMNLLNRFELHKRMFYIVSGVLFSSMVLFFQTFMRYARKQKLL